MPNELANRLYLLFSGADYSAASGWDDFIGSSSTIEGALELLEPPSVCNEWYQVVDIREAVVVASGASGLVSSEPNDNRKRWVPNVTQEESGQHANPNA